MCLCPPQLRSESCTLASGSRPPLPRLGRKTCVPVCVPENCHHALPTMPPLIAPASSYKIQRVFPRFPGSSTRNQTFLFPTVDSRRPSTLKTLQNGANIKPLASPRNIRVVDRAISGSKAPEENPREIQFRNKHSCRFARACAGPCEVSHGQS